MESPLPFEAFESDICGEASLEEEIGYPFEDYVNAEDQYYEKLLSGG
jgi:hypothetical protein